MDIDINETVGAAINRRVEAEASFAELRAAVGEPLFTEVIGPYLCRLVGAVAIGTIEGYMDALRGLQHGEGLHLRFPPEQP